MRALFLLSEAKAFTFTQRKTSTAKSFMPTNRWTCQSKTLLLHQRSSGPHVEAFPLRRITCKHQKKEGKRYPQRSLHLGFFLFGLFQVRFQVCWCLVWSGQCEYLMAFKIATWIAMCFRPLKNKKIAAITFGASGVRQFTSHLGASIFTFQWLELGTKNYLIRSFITAAWSAEGKGFG